MGAKGREKQACMTVWLPRALHRAIKETAQYQASAASALVREAISHYLVTITLPALLDNAKRSTSAAKIGTMRLVEHIKTGLADNSEPGRLRNRRLRGYYLLYCRAAKRDCTKPMPFAQWRGTIDEITLTDPAGHSAPTLAAKQAAREAKRDRVAARLARQARAGFDRGALYARLGKTPPK